MKKTGWRFPPLSGGNQQGYTKNDIEGFKGHELIDNLAREICQNSLDAYIENNDVPVKVVFELRKVHKQDFDVFSQYATCLKGCRRYWEDNGDNMDEKLEKFVVNAEKALCENDIPILVASDYNTKGLGGSRSRKKNSSWEALTSSDGISVKNDEASAGSYGIGKNAPFACSSLSMVFYNTLSEDGESAFIGVARLATLFDENNEPTQGIGRYQVNDNENKTWNPIYPEDKNKFRDSFLRTESGTDVIIVGFSRASHWLTNVMKAVLKNFFVAISENKLVVELKDGLEHIVISAESISRLFSDMENDSEMVSASQLYKAFTTPSVKESFNVFEPDDVEIYIKADASYKRTIANFRATGMLVGTYYRRIIQHYAAVVIIRGKKLGKLLKDTEPPRHNRWDYKQIDDSDRERRKEAKRAIEMIEGHVFNLLKSQFEVVTEKTVDAAGVGDYIPDDFDDMSGQPEGDDILKARIKIGNIKTQKTPKGTTTQVAVQEKGTEKPGTVRNHRRHPNPFPRPKPPVPVVPKPDDLDPTPGATPGNGSKTIITPNLIAQRAFPISSSQGLYKIVIKPAEDYNNMYIECFAVGEDGRSDPLELETFTYDGQNVRVSGGKAGPVKVKAETIANFFATFWKKEKMKLSLQLTEVVKK